MVRKRDTVKLRSWPWRQRAVGQASMEIVVSFDISADRASVTPEIPFHNKTCNCGSADKKL